MLSSTIIRNAIAMLFFEASIAAADLTLRYFRHQLPKSYAVTISAMACVYALLCACWANKNAFYSYGHKGLRIILTSLSILAITVAMIIVAFLATIRF